jgi:hypothetical protein
MQCHPDGAVAATEGSQFGYGRCFVAKNAPQHDKLEKSYLLNNLGMAAYRPEGLSGSTRFFEETFGTFPPFF